MARVERITDPGDPRVADYRTLRDPELRKRYEHEAGVFIAEGPGPVAQLLASRYPARSLLVDERRLDRVVALLGDRDVPVYVAARDVLYATVAFPAHQGVLGCGGRLPPLPVGETLAGARRALVLEAMNDHENLGALFRTARAFGVDAVLLAPGCADPLYRRSVRVSMGHVLHLPHAPIGALPAALDDLRAAGLLTVALTPDPAAGAITDVDATRPLALLLGAEGPGLSTETLAAADIRARIPTNPAVDSLNVAAAAAVALYALQPAAGVGGAAAW